MKITKETMQKFIEEVTADVLESYKCDCRACTPDDFDHVQKLANLFEPEDQEDSMDIIGYAIYRIVSALNDDQLKDPTCYNQAIDYIVKILQDEKLGDD